MSRTIYQKSLLIISFIVLITITVSAQKKVWYAGKVILKDNTIIEGDVNYNLVHQIIRIKSSGVEKSYNQSMISSFELYDDQGNLQHDFYVLPVNLRGPSYPNSSIIEYLYATKDGIVLIAHHYILSATDKHEATPSTYHDIPLNSLGGGPSKKFTQNFNEQKHSFHADQPKELYLINEEGEYFPFTKKNVLTVLVKHKKEIKKYLATNHTSTDNHFYFKQLQKSFWVASILRMLNYYDTLD